MLGKLVRLVRHRWREPDPRRVLPAEALARLADLVARSERRHRGQIVLCVEAGLPWRYVWRGATVRERAVNQFSRLRVWDTEHNSGVLVYLLLAEHAIEIVADRGVARHVSQDTWNALVARLGHALAGGDFEAGLTRALAEASDLLEAHFPAAGASAGEETARANELPDAPVIG